MWRSCSYRIKVAPGIFFVLPVNTKEGSNDVIDEANVQRNNENKDWILDQFDGSCLVDSSEVQDKNAKVWWLFKYENPHSGIMEQTLMIVQERISDTKKIEAMVEKVTKKIPVTKIQRGAVIL